MLLGLRCWTCTSETPPPHPLSCKVRSLFVSPATSLLVLLHGSNDLVSFTSVFPATSNCLAERGYSNTYIKKEGLGTVSKEGQARDPANLYMAACDEPALGAWTVHSLGPVSSPVRPPDYSLWPLRLCDPYILLFYCLIWMIIMLVKVTIRNTHFQWNS